MEINLKDVQKWYAGKINKQIFELDSYDLFCAKVAYDYACENCIMTEQEKQDANYRKYIESNKNTQGYI